MPKKVGNLYVWKLLAVIFNKIKIFSQKRISPVESVENEPKPNSRKKGIFKLGGDKSQKSRAAIPSKYLPSALRKKRNDSASKVETDSPLIQGNSDDFNLFMQESFRARFLSFSAF